MTTNKKLKIIVALAIFGILNAFYLSYDWIFWVSTMVWGWACDINDTLSCSTVIDSDLTKFFWIPFPVIALTVYPIILITTLLGLFWKIQKHFKILAAMWAGWMMFNWYIIYQETFNIGAFCPVCLMCTGLIITIFILSFLEVKKDCIASKKK